jgi:addiction module RelE/StbE family toxin
MGYKVILRQGAIDDLADIVGYISKDNPQAAERLGNRLVTTAESLAEMPYRGKAVRGRPGVWRIIHRPYLIFYEIDEPSRVVEVLRFWHSARDLASLKLREQA